MPADVGAEVAALERIVLPAEEAQRNEAKALKNGTAPSTAAKGAGSSASKSGPSTSGANLPNPTKRNRRARASDSDETDEEETARSLPPGRRNPNAKKDAGKK